MRQYDNLLKRAIEFHGHLGPYLVLGLKAGFYANEILGKDPFKMKAFIETHTSPPESCFIDGIQFSTGCTLGKGNISIKESRSLKVCFKKDDKELKLILKKKIMDELKSLPSVKEEWEKFALNLYLREMKEIFDIE